MKILHTFIIVIIACLFWAGSATHSFAQSGHKPEIIAYYSGNGENIHEYPLDKLTQIIFSFLHLKGDTIYISSEAKKAALQRVVSMKEQYPQLKVLISLGGWGGCEFCSPVFSNPESRKNFAASVARVLTAYNADGIDLDWEYPTIPGHPGHAYAPEDKDNFTDLVIQIRQAIGPGKELSFAAGGFSRFLEESVDWHAIMPHMNRVNLMTYDLVHGFSTQTGHHTALKSSEQQKESTDYCVQWLLNHGVPSHQLVIGAAFYARVWKEVPAENNGLYQPGVFKRGVGFKQHELLSTDSGWVHHWDATSLAPYAYHPGNKEYATFDNPQSLHEKVKYMHRHKLGGIMFWELMNDRYKDGLLEAIAKAVAEIYR